MKIYRNLLFWGGGKIKGNKADEDDDIFNEGEEGEEDGELD